MREGQMNLGVFIYGTGHHIAGWRLPNAQSGGENLDLMVSCAQKAESAKLDFVFLADALHSSPDQHPSIMLRLEPVTLLSAVAMVTSKIGLAATASTTYTEPYNLARLFGSLDHISGGRAGWNIVAGAVAAVANNFGRDKHPPHALRYEIAREFVDVVTGLWDSWDDDAIVKDKATGAYVDSSKMHRLNHVGTHFQVEGPLNLSRMPQGYPVLIQAGASEYGRDFAARTAEVVFTADTDLESAIALAKDLRSRASAVGRDPRSLKILPGICPIIAESEEAAREKLAELGRFIDPVSALKLLSVRIGHDLSAYDLDGSLPDLPASEVMQGYAVALTKMAREKNLTIRQLRDHTAAAQGHLVVLGTAESVAETLIDWYNSGAVDGFNVMPAWLPGGFDDFVDYVVPILQARGVFRSEYEGSTLREHLRLERPKSRYS